MNEMRRLMETVNDVFDLLPDDRGTAKRLEVANRDGRVAWDVYRDQPQELARRVKLLAQHLLDPIIYRMPQYRPSVFNHKYQVNFQRKLVLISQNFYFSHK